MKAILTSLCTCVFLSAAGMSAHSQSAPANTVRAFYKWYVHALNHNVPEPLKEKTAANKYVTTRLLNRIAKQMASEEGIDADYFLSAQDFDAKWETNIVIGKVTTTAATSTVNAVLPSKLMGNSKLKIMLKKEAGTWKIDKVNDWNI